MMKLYDEVIGDILSALKSFPSAEILPVFKGRWKDVGRETMILRGDMVYELGGGNLPAIGSTMVTMEKSLVPKDEALLYGSDLADINKDMPYARIALVRVKQGSFGQGNELYNRIRKLEFTKYHVFPEGYMMRISAAGEREMVRVGKRALQKGLGFAQVGSMFLSAYHQNQEVEAVKMIFITRPDFPYPLLEEQVRKSEQITKAIDHILKDLTMDCKACSLKQICDTVEGMKELHFGTAKKPS